MTAADITVADLDAVTAFFVGLGLKLEGTRMFVESDFLDTVIGIPNSRTEIVIRNVAYEVDDLQAAVDQLAMGGYGLVGGVGQYEHMCRMAYVRGPEGIIVSLAERIG